MVPGLFADATMWFANVGPLAQEYRVYCIDLPVFGGKSEPGEQAVEGVADYASLFDELRRAYGHDRVSLVGLSYGSWLILALARENPEAVASLVMLDPSESFAKMGFEIAWRGFWSFAFFPNRAKYARFFDWLGGGYSDDQVDVWFEHMLDVIEHGSVGMFDVPQHRVYKPAELTMIDVPVLIMAGGKPILYRDVDAFARAAHSAIPHAEIDIVPGTGHSLNMEKADVINARMITFLRENAFALPID